NFAADRRGQFDMFNATTWNHLPQRDNPVEVIKRQRLEQNRVDHTENRAVCADPQRQCQRLDYSEAWFFQEHPPSVTNILKQCPHNSLPDQRLILEVKLPAPLVLSLV